MNVFLDALILLVTVVRHILYSLFQWIRKPSEKVVANEICLITGTAGGLGRLLALEFAKRGATLVLWDINREGNAATAKQAKELGVNVHVYACDVSRRETVYETAERVRRAVGDVTILVNNAGVVAGQPLLQCPDELLERTLRTNCHAHFWTVKAFLPKMIEMNHGHVVTIASYLGLIAAAGVEDYCASKFATVGFHESLSHQLKAKRVDGVKTTLVCPYNVNRSMVSGLRIRKELETLVCRLKPEDYVKAAMSAILINQPMVCIPSVMYLAAFSKQ
ncbi:retinol dehydrogenase 10-A-like [Lissotriton helveticus]